MSNRWPGGVIRKTPVTPAGPLQNGAASGVWSLADAAYWTKQGLWPIAGNVLAVEDVFSTWLYTGTGAAQTITNGINVSGSGGLVIQKERSSDYADGWFWADTVRGANNILKSQNANGQITSANTISAFSSTGFTAGSNISFSGSTYASWTFREAPKFFDIVTYTGDGTNGRSISHNLGIAPGCVIIKRTDASEWWAVAHRGNGTTGANAMSLNDTVGSSYTTFPVTSTSFTVSTSGTNGIYNGLGQGTNTNGATYVAYLYAHDTSSTGLIQCGSYTGNGAAEGPTVTLGWEPQWVIVKNASASSVWMVVDNMRGMTADGNCGRLDVNQTFGESATTGFPLAPNATGFQVKGATALNGSGQTSIYIAIRRGPMRTPTLGTSVFAPALGNSSGAGFTSGFPVDAAFIAARSITEHKFLSSRLTGTGLTDTDQSIAEYTDANNKWDYNTQYYGSALGSSWVSQMFRRAPGFMDVVCYTGTGANLTVNHNLGVTPELIFIKNRSGAWGWDVEASFTSSGYSRGALNTNARFFPQTYPDTIVSQPTATQFVVSNNIYVGSSGNNYVAYLFASCPGVSKVGSYTGNGSSQTINCAFTTGARYVLIKRTDSTGDWLVWDSARGIVAGNDPYLALNSTAAEVTTNDSVDTDNTGFIVNQVAASNVNVNGGTYIFLAIA